ncbi:MAG TPA: hypothetical protein VGU46_02780 [Acidobacteriaceae bacterium]|nr:hypothetical protein [Acidobacteriaceae bacterium]
MPTSVPPTNSPQRSSRTLVYVMLAIIVLSVAAFLVFHPDPSGAGHSKTNTTSDH